MNYYIYSIALIAFCFAIRRNILSFVFLLIASTIFYYIPLIFVDTDSKYSIHAEKSIEMFGYFLGGYFFTYLILYFIDNKKIDYKLTLPPVKIVERTYPITIALGLFLKLLGGDLIHMSIFLLPWSFPFLYGPADRIFQIGVGLLFVAIYLNGFNYKRFFSLALVVAVSLLTGSRIVLIIPISMLIIFALSNSSSLGFLKNGVIACIFAMIIIGGIGYLRTDETEIDFIGLMDIVLFRVSDFYWPARFAEMIDDGDIALNLSWLISDLLAFFPSFVSQFFLGISVFDRDLDLLINVGIGSPWMSVPMTLLGEGYYWNKNGGIVLIAVLSCISIYLVSRFVSRQKGLLKVLIFVQLYRYIFVLPLAAFPEVVALCTKDLLFSYIFALLIRKYVARFPK